MSEEELIIEAGRAERQYWRDLWRYRELFYFLAWRDILVRYKQTVVGVTWSLLRPVLTMAVLTVVFHRIARLDSGGVPYPILILAALLPWQLFANALVDCGSSVVNNANLISKVYFPRLVVPASTVITSLLDFVISLALLLVLMVGYQFWPSWRLLLLPGFILLAVGAALGGGLWLSALTVKYRDFRIIVPFIIQFGLFVSPVGYSSDRVPETWRWLYSLNPMVGVIDGFRWVILGPAQTLSTFAIVNSVLLVVLLLGSGVWYFRKTEKSFADVI